jgi:hypothetical protein
MSLHNYFVDSDLTLMFQWGSLREDYYKIGDRLSWNWVNRPTICNEILYIPALDDSVDDLGTGYYVIEIKNDIFRNFKKISRDKYNLEFDFLSKYM